MSDHKTFPKGHRGLYKLTPRQLKFLHNKTNCSNVNELSENLASQCSLRPTARSISTGSNMPGCSNSKNNSNLVGNAFSPTLKYASHEPSKNYHSALDKRKNLQNRCTSGISNTSFPAKTSRNSAKKSSKKTFSFYTKSDNDAFRKNFWDKYNKSKKRSVNDDASTSNISGHNRSRNKVNDHEKPNYSIEKFRNSTRDQVNSNSEVNPGLYKLSVGSLLTLPNRNIGEKRYKSQEPTASNTTISNQGISQQGKFSKQNGYTRSRAYNRVDRFPNKYFSAGTNAEQGSSELVRGVAAG